MSIKSYHASLLEHGIKFANGGTGIANKLAMMAVICASIGTAFILFATNGSFFAPAAVVGILFVLLITLYRLDWGFFLFIGTVLLFDQTPPRGFETSIIGLEYFLNLKSLRFLSNVDLAVVTPMELHFFLVFIVWILLIAMGKKVVLNHVPVWFSALLFFSWLLISAAYGMSRGGDFLPALWELRALFYLGIMYFFVPQIIQTREQIHTLIWIFIGTFSFKALQGLVRIARLGFSMGDRTELTNHEDPLFFVSLFILFFGFILFGSHVKQRKVIAWISLPLFVVFILAQRRAAYGAFGVGLIAFMFLLPKQHLWKIFKFLIPACIVIALYLGVFWNSTSAVGYPAQLVKSSFSSDKETAGERYYSNLYREFENFNLSSTLKRSPVFGIGFGNKYDQPISLVFIPFSLRDYIPHNEIFWLIVKSGMVGFFFFWLFLDAFILRAAHLFYRLADPYLKSICAMIIIAIIGQVVVSYYDLQLTFYRNMVYLGLVMGFLPTLEILNAVPAESRLHPKEQAENSSL